MASPRGTTMKRPAAGQVPPSLLATHPDAANAQSMRELFGDVDGSIMLDRFWERFDAGSFGSGWVVCVGALG
eukprot:3174777-Pyramimonas_sp.AAC.1